MFKKYLRNFSVSLLVSMAVLAFANFSAYAEAPPVRVSVISGSGDGIEQEVVDQISSGLEGSKSIALSTVNPDWFVVCTIEQGVDQNSGQIRCNGSVLIRTKENQVINKFAAQKYNQDFALSPGTANKALVDQAARDCARMLTSRSVQPILEAADTEMEMRDRMIHATLLSEQDKFEEALSLLTPIGRDTPQFERAQRIRRLIESEEIAKLTVEKAEQLHQQGKNPSAIATLKTVPSRSRRYAIAQQKISQYKSH